VALFFMDNYFELLFILAGFLIIALASKDIGRWFTRIRLPKISGFLFAGLVAGPFVLNLISTEALESLRFVDEISLAFIAFAAGSELYLPELKNRFRGIGWVTAGLVIATFPLVGVAVFMLAEFIPFMQGMSTTGRVSVALLAAAIMVARSPSVAIAIINELRAKGPFTQLALGVTIISDIAVIVLFALSSSVADALLTNVGLNLTFVLLITFELVITAIAGYTVGKILQFILSTTLGRNLKTAMILATGFGVFVFSGFVREYTHDNLPFEIFLEPLLICMVGGFLVNNYGSYRTDFSKILHDTGPLIYVAFFTLVGASLKLDVLLQIWPIALALFLIRLVAIIIGAFGGGLLAGEPMRHNRLSWMVFVTQAGVALGLAKEVAVEFPEFGDAFATMIIAVVVLNEMVGPLFFKQALNRVGEAHPRAEAPEFDGQRDAIIFGLSGQSVALARQLCAHGWQVKIASRQTDYTQYEDEISDSMFNIQPISGLNLEALHQLNAEQAETIVTLLADDESYLVCELIYEHFGTENVVVQLNNRANFERFHRLGALTVDPATAIVSLLDHMVRSPSAASLLLGAEVDQDVIDVEVRDSSLHGVALRDLRLPLDTLVLSIHRNGQALVPHGYTRLERGDQVTVVGSLKSLDEVMLRFDA